MINQFCPMKIKSSCNFLFLLALLFIFRGHSLYAQSTKDAVNQKKISSDKTSATHVVSATVVYDDCKILKILADGSLLTSLNGSVDTTFIFGLALPKPLPANYQELITWVFQKSRKPCYCIVKSMPKNGKALIQVFYFGWQDKSGDVWIDLANTLLEEGVAIVAKESFPEKKEYLTYESEAKKQHKGIWKNVNGRKP
jgi:hypothetical protein